MDITVAIIEDQKETREMLKILISGSEGFLCLATYDNAESAVAELPDIKPDVVLVDIHLGDQTGIEVVHRLKDKCPFTHFIMCTSFEDADHIFAALKAGADGYIVKSTPPSKILEAITDAHRGGAPMNSHIAKKVIGVFQIDVVKKQNAELEKLSDREREILDGLAKGYRYKEIATRLFISPETVRSHISKIYNKLQVNTGTQAINKAMGN